ncbi:MAG TPA: hypothetical protein PLZ16_10255, partial [Gammaproteobacteria bacterium]|nr:hypothetical protein [Gammaproteobacteria bacterium]
AHDGLLAMAMIHEIITHDFYDKDFVKEWTVGFEALKQSAAQFPIEKVAADIWLDPELIRKAVRLYASSKPACIVDGNGLDMQFLLLLSAGRKLSAAKPEPLFEPKVHC